MLVNVYGTTGSFISNRMFKTKSCDRANFKGCSKFSHHLFVVIFPKHVSTHFVQRHTLKDFLSTRMLIKKVGHIVDFIVHLLLVMIAGGWRTIITLISPKLRDFTSSLENRLNTIRLIQRGPSFWRSPCGCPRNSHRNARSVERAISFPTTTNASTNNPPHPQTTPLRPDAD